MEVAAYTAVQLQAKRNHRRISSVITANSPAFSPTSSRSLNSLTDLLTVAQRSLSTSIHTDLPYFTYVIKPYVLMCSACRYVHASWHPAQLRVCSTAVRAQDAVTAPSICHHSRGHHSRGTNHMRPSTHILQIFLPVPSVSAIEPLGHAPAAVIVAWLVAKAVYRSLQ